MEKIEILFDPELTDKEMQDLIVSEVKKIEKSGGNIIAAEPIEKVYVKIIGRRFTVERN